MHQKFCSTGINYFGVVRFLNPFPLFYSFYVSHIGRRKRNVWIFRLHRHWNLKWLKHFSPNKFCYQSPYRSVMTDFSYYIMVKPYDSFFFFVIQPFISVLLGIKKIVLAWTSFCLLYDTRTQNGYWTQSIFISCFTMFMLHYLPVLWGISLEWYSSSYWINYIEFAKFRAIIPHLILIDFFLWLWATECYQRTDFDLV